MLNLHTHTKSNEDNIINVLRVIQICDSNFPIGSFNHSYGMESYLRNNKITNAESLKEYLDVFLNNVFIYSDGLAIRMLYEYLNKNEWEKILELDRMLTVQTIAKETRNGSKLIASRMIKLFLDLYDSDILKEYEEKINGKKAFGHPAIVFGLLMYSLNFNEEETLRVFTGSLKEKITCGANITTYKWINKDDLDDYTFANGELEKINAFFDTI